MKRYCEISCHAVVGSAFLALAITGRLDSLSIALFSIVFATSLYRTLKRLPPLLTTKAIVRMTDRVTILPRHVVEAELSVGVLRAIELRDVTFQRRIGVRALAEVELSPLAARFIEVLTAQA